MELIIGKRNSSEKVSCWKVNDDTVGMSSAVVGDYAIVESERGNDIVEILSFVVTDPKNLKRLSVPCFDTSNRVKIIVPKQYVEGE